MHKMSSFCWFPVHQLCAILEVLYKLMLCTGGGEKSQYVVILLFASNLSSLCPTIFSYGIFLKVIIANKCSFCYQGLILTFSGHSCSW